MRSLMLLVALTAVVVVASRPVRAEDPCVTAKGFKDADQIAACLARPSKGIRVGEGADVGVGLPAVTFEFGSAQLTPGGRAQLDEVVKALKYDTLKSQPVTIEGHTDAVGSDDYNQQLSELRADAVLRYFDQNGLDTQKMSAVGFGEARLLPDLDPTADDQRRVEIKIAPDR